MNSTLYEQDYYLWLEKTVQLLKDGNFSAVDVENLIEEVDDIRHNEKETLFNSLRMLLVYLLKWKYQTHERLDNLRSFIIDYRQTLRDILEDSPSLQSYLTEILEECYQDAKELTSVETELSLDTFPESCLFSLEEVLKMSYFPESLQSS